jgi:hypothetical protein
MDEINSGAAQIAEIIAIAREHYDETALIEDGAQVRQEQGGCYVQAWVWLENVYIEEEG